MTEVVNLANFANSLDSSGGLSTSALNAPFPVTQGGTGATTAAGARSNLGIGSIALENANSVNITGGSVSGISPLAVVDGGTGASTAAVARSNLGLAIDSDVFGYIQPGANGNIARSDGSSWKSTPLSSVVGINVGAGTVARNGFFGATFGPTGQILIQLHVHVYAAYANYGPVQVGLMNPISTVVRYLTLRTMEWDSRVSGDGASILYFYSEPAAANRTFNWGFWVPSNAPGVVDNAFYSWIGT